MLLTTSALRCCSTFTKVGINQALDRSRIGSKLRVDGWIKSIRNQKKNAFVDIDDGLSTCKLQVIIDSSKIDSRISLHSAVSAFGTLEESEHPQQDFELIGDTLELVNPVSIPFAVSNRSPEVDMDVDLAKYPFSPRKFYPDHFTRAYPMFRSKLSDFSSLLRVRSAASFAIHSYLQSQDYIQIHTPVLTSNDCEGAGEVFQVMPANHDIVKAMRKDAKRPDSEAYFDKAVYLTVSGQLHLEAVTNGLMKTYTFGPTFRAEMGRSRRHLCEFSMVEAELGFAHDLQDILDLMENLIKSSLKSVLNSNMKDLEVYEKLCKMNKSSKNSPDIQLIQSVADSNFIVMRFQEAVDIIEAQFGSLNKGAGFSKEHELYLTEKHCKNTPVFVTDWPKKLKSFYCRLNDKNEALAVDLLFPRVGELCGGSLREHRAEMLEKAVLDSGIDLELFQWYLQLRKSGASPTGGFGMGFERLIQFMLGCNNIKDVLPFPRTPHNCLL